jgi:large subunit ribosomal protein L10
MKKIGLIFREVSENRIKHSLKESSSFFVIKYSGLSSPDLTALRLSLKNSQADLFVVKNSVARRALKASGLEVLLKSVEGPCGLVFSKSEPVEASRALFNFTKDHDKLKLEGGFLKDRLLEKKDIEAMAKLPTLEVLRAQLVMTLNSPLTRLARALNHNLVKLVICLDKIKEKKNTKS